MALPWLAVIGVEYLVLRRSSPLWTCGRRPQLDSVPAAPRPPRLRWRPRADARRLRSPLVLGIPPVAIAGAVAVAVSRRPRARERRRTLAVVARAETRVPARSSWPSASSSSTVQRSRPRPARRPLVPGRAELPRSARRHRARRRAGQPGQQPAGHLVLPRGRVGGSPGAVLAVLIGVNIGPNLTYVGSLATLLWRRILHARDAYHRSEFSAWARSPCRRLVVGVAALWIGLQSAGCMNTWVSGRRGDLEDASTRPAGHRPLKPRSPSCTSSTRRCRGGRRRAIGRRWWARPRPDPAASIEAAADESASALLAAATERLGRPAHTHQPPRPRRARGHPPRSPR